jgi:hypothetical protein
MKISYIPSKNYIRFKDALMDKPELAVVTEHPDITTKSEDGTKALLTLFCEMKEEQLD